MYIFVLLIFVIPLLGYLADQRRLRRIDARWRSAAAELGLQVGGAAPRLSMSGVLEGVRIELVQSAEYRYKQAPLMTLTARARLLPSGGEALVSSYRTPPRRAEIALRSQLFEHVVVEGGGIVCRADGELDLDGLEELLGTLINTARVVAKEQAEQEDHYRGE